jgi:hypothetical protein
MRTLLMVLVAVTTSLAAVESAGQSAPAPGPATDTVAAKPLSTQLGLVVFPARGQTQNAQATDETECYAWSKQQTGVDPFAAPVTQQAATQAASATPPPKQPGGERLRGAARGAAAGAVVGEIANDDAGEGAAIGATAGVVAGGAHQRKAQAQAQQQAAAQQQQAAAQSKQAAADQKAMFNKGFAACLEARGYTVK